ncbi:hypothetical protein CASFOL_042404 [Castilleja foliolosa]|uniref:rRNA N-glycosylase n=1 Tax=Castilleja foliolosa TaxID=1961234 RepID=A0ABD3BAE6_9LAMI
MFSFQIKKFPAPVPQSFSDIVGYGSKSRPFGEDKNRMKDRIDNLSFQFFGEWVVHKFRKSDLYFQKFQNRNGEFLLTDPDFDNSGGLVQMCSIGLGSSYPSLVTNSGVTRKVDVELGLERLEVNFNSLARLPMLRNNNRLTKELKAKVADVVLHSVLIFAEGARFAPISDYVTERLRHGRWELFNLKREHESYVNFWFKLSKILVADREGLSSIEEIEAKIPDGVKFGECKFLLNDKAVDTVEDVKKIVRLLSKQSVAKSIGKLAALKSRSKSK